MSKHTPGPWKTWPSIHNGRTYVVENNYKATDYGHVATAVTETDAQLIAAAPELLEALKELEKNFFFDPKKDKAGYANEMRQKVIAAINKAEGKS